MQKNKTYIFCILLLIMSILGVIFGWRQYQISAVAVTLHNLGNQSMKEYLPGDETALIQAREYYSGALSVEENPDTRYNYERVQELLEKTQEKQDQEQNQEQKQQEEGDKQQSEESQETDSEQNSGSGSNQSGSGADTESNQGNSQEEQELTGQEKQQLEELTQQIKAEQNYNQQFYNKAEKSTNFHDAFESFFGQINRGGEKDW